MWCALCWWGMQSDCVERCLTVMINGCCGGLEFLDVSDMIFLFMDDLWFDFIRLWDKKIISQSWKRCQSLTTHFYFVLDLVFNFLDYITQLNRKQSLHIYCITWFTVSVNLLPEKQWICCIPHFTRTRWCLYLSTLKVMCTDLQPALCCVFMVCENSRLL